LPAVSGLSIRRQFAGHKLFFDRNSNRYPPVLMMWFSLFISIYLPRNQMHGKMYNIMYGNGASVHISMLSDSNKISIRQRPTQFRSLPFT
jgi:hypothetical protein